MYQSFMQCKFDYFTFLSRTLSDAASAQSDDCQTNIVSSSRRYQICREPSQARPDVYNVISRVIRRTVVTQYLFTHS